MAVFARHLFLFSKFQAVPNGAAARLRRQTSARLAPLSRFGYEATRLHARNEKIAPVG